MGRGLLPVFFPGAVLTSQLLWCKDELCYLGKNVLLVMKDVWHLALGFSQGRCMVRTCLGDDVFGASNYHSSCVPRASADDRRKAHGADRALQQA